MKRVAIHQPQYLPWVGYFNKIISSDVFIFLDDVQYQKNGLQNRNMIKGSQGGAWLTLPVKASLGMEIKDVTVTNSKEKKKHIKTLKMNYARSLYYEEVFSLLEAILGSEDMYISSISTNIILALLEYLGYEGEVLWSSQLNVSGQGSERVLNLSRKIGASHYLSGSGGLNYLDLSSFKREGIEVLIQSYRSPEYHQCFPKLEFIKDLSVIDLIFNEGKASKNTINASGSWSNIVTY